MQTRPWIPPKKRARSALMSVCVCGLLFLFACPSGPAGPGPVDFCQGREDCASGQECLNSLCVVNVGEGKLPWQEHKVDANEPGSEPKSEPGSEPGSEQPDSGEVMPEGPTGCPIGSTRECVTDAPGACKKGNQTCEADQSNIGRWGLCVSSQPGDEICNGIDDNCNGQIDDNPTDANKSCTVAGQSGPCELGLSQCQEGKIVCVSDATPSIELCDGKDNDCDGDVDEDCGCKDGDTQPCYTGSKGCENKGGWKCVGACKTGTQLCDNKGKWGKCSGDTVPTAEDCTNVDDNCDGLVDRVNDGSTLGAELTRSCYGASPTTQGVGSCKAGVQTCLSGNWLICKGAVTPKSETCNNIDDDCDGKIDEDYPSVGKDCFAGVGECKQKGKEVCNSTGDGASCNAVALSPTAEKCDKKDHDCDGNPTNTFEALGDICYAGLGACKKSGVKVCLPDGSALDCNAVPSPPTKEKCNGIDDDCDGHIDKGCICTPGDTRPCFNVDSAKRNVGNCKDGQQKCNAAGTWGDCVGEVKDTIETCDGFDEDCDGNVDAFKRACYTGSKGCVLVTGPTGTSIPASYTCQGTCKGGTQTCKRGSWETCKEQTTPIKEICDGKDNDCDGKTDEDWPLLSSLCSAGTGECKRFKPYKCKPNGSDVYCPAMAGTPGTEVCDNKDNNCDGSVDENVTRRCGSNVGACATGSEKCVGGKWLGVCQGEVKPTVEKCDTIDNDCDGKTDEICGSQISYAMVSSNGTIAKRRGFVTTNAKTVNQGQFIVSRSSGTDNCTNSVVIATPYSPGAATTSYTCEGGKWRIFTFSTKTGGLKPEYLPFHVVHAHASTFAKVTCVRATSSCLTSFFSPTTNIVSVQGAVKGRVLLANESCRDPKQPIFAMLEGRDAGYIRARALGLVAGVGKPLCDIRTFDLKGNPVVRSFVVWFPEKKLFTWASANEQGTVEDQTYDFADSKPVYKEKWTVSVVNGIQTFDFFTTLFAAWLHPSAVVLTSRLKQPPLPLRAADPVLNPAAAVNFDSLGTVPNLNVISYDHQPNASAPAKKALPFFIMYIDTQ